jgi:hypothetical protein
METQKVRRLAKVVTIVIGGGLTIAGIVHLYFVFRGY